MVKQIKLLWSSILIAYERLKKDDYAMGTSNREL